MTRKSSSAVAEPVTETTVETPQPEAVEQAARTSRGPAFNQVILLGRLTKDVDIRFTPSGTRVANLSMVTNESSEPEYHDLVAFDRLVEALGNYLLKGRLIQVTGRLHRREWTAQDGTKRRVVEVQVQTVQLLDRPTSNGS